MPMQCPNCSAILPENARFCSQCGLMLQRQEPTEGGSTVTRSGVGRFVGMLILSLVLSILLTAVFHMPIFILGTVLPLFWIGRKR